jgi:hypothetical protein
MPGRQAKLISDSVLQRMLGHVRRRSPARDRVMILLSVRAGLITRSWSPFVACARSVGDGAQVVRRCVPSRLHFTPAGQ